MGLLPSNRDCLVARKSISVKGEVHERYRKKAIQLSTSKQRVTIAELVEFLGRYLPLIKVEEIAQEIKK